MKKFKYFLLLILLICSNFLCKASVSKNFQVRGFHLDFRTQVMSVSAIKDLARDLSHKGINTLVIEYEASFPFKKHATLSNKYAFTRSDIKEIVNYCSSIGIDVIPLQNCFGHCEYILRHNRYAKIREDKKDISQVCPLEIEEAKKVFKEIFADVISLHKSQYLHIGADETRLLGYCDKCSKVDKSKLFVDYVNAMCEVVKELGKTPIIWADIILKYPESINELPKDLIFEDWNYGWNPNHFGDLSNLLNLGVKIWGASAMRCSPDDIYITQWMKHFNNLATFIPFARSHGYEGILNTSWSTSGQYGFHYAPGWEILSMQPIREVYPMNGFNILIDAFIESINTDIPLNINDFIISFGKKQYGLSEKEAAVFLDYFLIPQEKVSKSKAGKETIKDALEECKNMKSEISLIHPIRNQSEFEHYKLMLDFRINYLEFKEVEEIYQSQDYKLSMANELYGKMNIIMKAFQDLNKRLIVLNNEYLKEGCCENICSGIQEKMQNLYDSLKKQTLN